MLVRREKEDLEATSGMCATNCSLDGTLDLNLNLLISKRRDLCRLCCASMEGDDQIVTVISDMVVFGS